MWVVGWWYKTCCCTCGTGVHVSTSQGRQANVLHNAFIISMLHGAAQHGDYYFSLVVQQSRLVLHPCGVVSQHVLSCCCGSLIQNPAAAASTQHADMCSLDCCACRCACGADCAGRCCGCSGAAAEHWGEGRILCGPKVSAEVSASATSAVAGAAVSSSDPDSSSSW